ncbi:Nucleoporin nup61 [Nosema granulosis]|uniref:Nucleoporin nup61 n=1 Tax=Nosema granulosis TaxID=83296 RepID=A0A9P6H4C1_9MICR|nr:Nucleoporin nup61 [Nosema granulosis]
MASNRKRKAEDQLSPYSRDIDTIEMKEETPKPEEQKIKKRAKATIGGRKGGVSDPDSIKGLLTSVQIVKPVVPDDKISGLNKSFVEAIRKVVERESNKDLSYLFDQYKKYLAKIENKS